MSAGHHIFHPNTEVCVTVRTQDHSRKAGDLILEILFTNNYDEDIQLLEDKDSVLYSGGPVDVLSWTSSTVGVLPTFKGDSESSDGAELELDTQLNKGKFLRFLQAVR